MNGFLSGGNLQVVCTGDCLVTWSANIYSIGLRSQVYDSFMEEFPMSHEDIVDDEHNFSSPTDGQSERAIQTLEDMLRACVLNLKGSLEEHLPLMEFAYNNSYHVSIHMVPYEALYGRPCRSLVC